MEEQVKRKRGRPRKNKLPEEIQALVDNTLVKQEAIIGLTSVQDTNNIKPVNSNKIWDVTLQDEIKFFDSNLSYELTGYRPITTTRGLDFDPSWFTEARDTYKRTGHYCSYRFKSKPYNDYWAEQYRRCREGLTVNGYTITGDNYFFLNFYTLPVVDKNKKSGAGTQDGFPTFFVSQYTFFHYFEMAKRLHLHCALMKARSIGFSEINAAIATNMFISIRQSFTIITCYDDKKLRRTYRKFTHALTFLDSKTDGGMFRLRQIEDSALTKTSGRYENKNGQKVPTGFQSTVAGVNGSDPSNIRGDRVDLIIYDEAGCHAPGTEVIMYDGSLKKVEDIKIGDVLMGDDGTPRNVLELHSGIDQMYKIIPKVGEPQIVNSNHILYGKHRNYNKNTYNEFTMLTKDYYDMITKNPRKKDGYKLVKSDKISFSHQDVPIDPYLFGFWLGDGNSDKSRFTSEDPEIIEYLSNYAISHDYKLTITDCENSKKCKHIYFGIKEGTVNQFTKKLKDLNVLNNKHIPDCYLYNDRETLLQLLAGLIDSDGTYCKDKYCIQITQCENRKHIIDQIEFICHTLGMKVSRDVRVSKERKIGSRTIKGGVNQYRITILYGHSQIPCKLPRKQTIDRDDLKSKSQKDRLDSTFKIEKAEVGEYYGFTLDGNQLFLLKDFTVCHNSWPDLTTAVIQGQELVEVQGIPRGIMMFGGTGGDKGKNLEGLRTIYYDPEAFKVLPYRHNYSQTGETVITAFFIPYFAQSLDPAYMDNRGVVNEEKFKEVLQEERNKLANIPKEYVKKCAERCWNAEEAFNLEGENRFNKVNIAEQLTQIRALKKCPPIETGFLEYKYKEGAHIEQNLDGFRWIPNQNGKIKILEHPLWTLPEKRDEDGNVIWRPPERIRDLYVIGIDGIDIGKSQTSDYTKDPSDFCLTVFKRAYGTSEPQFVALYKDRPNDIREAYKIAIKLAQYYNAIINIEATRQSIIPYARERKLLKLFMKRPRATLGDSVRNTNKQYGTPATPAIINHQTDLIADYINDYCYLIWFDEMLDEFNRYTDENKRKFDIVASAAMALLADEELQGIVPKRVEEIKDTWQDIGFYTDLEGRRRYGVIPKQNNQILTNNNFGQLYDDNRIRTSNTRLLEGYL